MILMKIIITIIMIEKLSTLFMQITTKMIMILLRMKMVTIKILLILMKMKIITTIVLLVEITILMKIKIIMEIL
jgi:hypothetical protein